MTAKLSIEQRTKKIEAALAEGDMTLTDLATRAQLSEQDTQRTVNYLKGKGRIQNAGDRLHLHPETWGTAAAAEPESPEAAALAEAEAPAALEPADPSPDVTHEPAGLQPVVEQTPANVPAPVPAEPISVAMQAVTFADVLRTLRDYRRDSEAEREALLAEVHQVRNDATTAALQHYAERDELNQTIARLQAEIEELRKGFKDAVTVAAEPPAEPAQMADTLPINLPDPDWYDAHTLSYLRLGWPKLSPERQEEIAPRLLHEICQHPSQRNSAWITIVRLVNQGDK